MTRRVRITRRPRPRRTQQADEQRGADLPGSTSRSQDVEQVRAAVDATLVHIDEVLGG